MRKICWRKTYISRAVIYSNYQASQRQNGNPNVSAKFAFDLPEFSYQRHSYFQMLMRDRRREESGNSLLFGIANSPQNTPSKATVFASGTSQLRTFQWKTLYGFSINFCLIKAITPVESGLSNGLILATT
ncbi:hypothetical protein OAG56_07290, partial [Mariniblastus sp.]|nr:hypothetical protein [Mariniblastus sp.]